MSQSTVAGSQPINRLSEIDQILLVLSGKGGVGKSTVTVELAISLAQMGKNVAILDIDLCGPSIGLMLNVDKQQTVMCQQDGWEPVTSQTYPNIKLMSIAFLLKDENSAVIWRGPKKHAMIRQFLTEVNWGQLDYLLIDTPPGTSDEHISIVETIKQYRRPDGAIVVTTPQALSINDVRREISFCHKAELPLVGIIENMSGFICPHCSECSDIFSKGGGQKLAEFANIPFLGAIPIDGKLAESLEMGNNFIEMFAESECAKKFQEIAKKLIERPTK